MSTSEKESLASVQISAQSGTAREATGSTPGAQEPQVVGTALTRKPLSLESRLIRSMLSTFGNPRVRIVLWNGDEISTSDEAPVLTAKIADRATLLKLCADPDLQFGEGY